MKKFNKVLASFTLALMTFSLCVSAATAPNSVADTFTQDTAIKMEMSTTADSVKPGDTFDVSVKVGLANSTNFVSTGFLNVSINYDPTVFSVAVSSSQPTKKSDSRYEDSDENEWYYMARNSGSTLNTSAVVSNTNWQAIYSQNLKHLLSTANNFVTYTFTVKDGVTAQSSSISFANCAMNNTTGTVTKQIADNGITANGPLTINITNGSQEPTYPSYSNEETFDGSESFASSDAFKDTTIDANTKAFTVFGKATQALGIGEYGIKVTATDDKTYTFKGLKEVAKDGLWAIKVVSPDGTFKFADGDTLTTKSIQTFEKDTFANVSMN